MPLFFRKQYLVIALRRRNHQLFGHKTPLVELMWVNSPLLLYILREIISHVTVGRINDAMRKLIMRYSRTVGKQLATTVSTVTVERHAISLVKLKWRNGGQ